MEVKELNDALEGIKAEVAKATGANKEALELQIKELEGKVSESIKKEAKAHFDAEIKGITEALELKFQSEIKAVQDHADKLDVKLQSKSKDTSTEKPSFEQEMKSVFKENFEEISTVRKGKSAKIEVDSKAVGDMTLGNNLTGDQPRVYSQTVVPITSPLINFSDLIGAPINIEGGTYTFPREIAGEGAIAFQTEGAAKSQIDYDFEMVDVTTDFLAGVTTYSKKMANNLPFLTSFIPSALRRDYAKQENTEFNTVLEAGALASTELAADNDTKIEQLMNEIARLETLDNPVNGIVLRPSDWWDIQATEKSTGAGFGLPGVVSYTNGQLYVNGIPVYKATWMTANKYYVGDWTRVRKVVTEGLSLEFSNENKDNFEKNNITARIEAQIGLAIERNTAVILGDFTAV